MSQKRHRRLLEIRDMIRKGDQVKDVHNDRWIPVPKDWIGDYYDPGWNDIFRYFYIDENEDVNDISEDEEEKPTFNFQEYKEDCSVLMRTPTGILEVEFYQDKLSPSKEFVELVTDVDGKKKLLWFKTDEFNASALEIL